METGSKSLGAQVAETIVVMAASFATVQVLLQLRDPSSSLRLFLQDRWEDAQQLVAERREREGFRLAVKQTLNDLTTTEEGS